VDDLLILTDAAVGSLNSELGPIDQLNAAFSHTRNLSAQHGPSPGEQAVDKVRFHELHPMGKGGSIRQRISVGPLLAAARQANEFLLATVLMFIHKMASPSSSSTGTASDAALINVEKSRPLSLDSDHTASMVKNDPDFHGTGIESGSGFPHDMVLPMEQNIDSIVTSDLLAWDAWNLTGKPKKTICWSLSAAELDLNQQSAVWQPLYRFMCSAEEQPSDTDQSIISTHAESRSVTFKMSPFFGLKSSLLLSSLRPGIFIISILLSVISCSLYWLELMHSSRLRLRLVQLGQRLIQVQNEHQIAIQREKELRASESVSYQRMRMAEDESWSAKLQKVRGRPGQSFLQT